VINFTVMNHICLCRDRLVMGMHPPHPPVSATASGDSMVLLCSTTAVQWIDNIIEASGVLIDNQNKHLSDY